MRSVPALPLAACVAAVLATVSLGRGASAGRELAGGPAAAPADGLITYTVVRSARQLFETTVTTPSARRLRTNDAVEYEPSVSPNGRRLLFVSTLAGSTDIYVAKRNGRGQVRLTTSAAAEYDPAWSPTGARIAWVRERAGRGEIWVMRGDGRGKRRVVAAKDAQNPAWSPDGKRIAFWDAQQSVVYSVASSGGAPTRLTAGQHPAWSPKGGRIAFARAVEGTWTIMLYDLSSHSARQLFEDAEENDGWPAWSRDGRRLAFERYDGDSDSVDIWVANADGTGARAVVGTVAEERNPQFTPDGARLTFTSDRTADSDIAVANLDGSGERFVAVGPESWEHDPSWAPDASRISFTSDGSGTLPVLALGASSARAAGGDDWDIYSVGADGKGRRLLTTSPADDVGPAWGPGQRIAFQSDRSGDVEVWTMAEDGTGAKQVTRHDGWDGDPTWSPDGTQLAYASERGDDSEIFVTSLDGRDTIQVTRNEADDDGPAWSPDGTTIAFDSSAGGSWSIWVAAPDGNDVRRVTRGARDEYPAWSPDGKWILFSRRSGDLRWCVMRVHPDGSGLSEVTSGRAQSWLPSAIAPAP